MSERKVIAIVVAAGSGTRMATSEGRSKQLIRVGGKEILAHTLDVFEACRCIDEVILVVRPGETGLFENLIVNRYGYRKVVRIIEGGAERQDSVRNGLLLLATESGSGGAPPDIVVIHDGARPFVSADHIEATVDAAWEHGAALLAVRVKDTIKMGTQDEQPAVSRTLDRESLWAAQTPQTFQYRLILEAHQTAQKDEIVATDDCALVERLGHQVMIVPGSYDNIKITTPEDIVTAETILSRRAREARFPQSREVAAGTRSDFLYKTGHGYDVHRLVPGRPLILGGVKIDYELGLRGHSDADVLVHAVMDSMLGAAGLGDIGRHFPDTDRQYKDISSLELLGRTSRLLSESGFDVVNVDATIVAQAPRLSGLIPEMRCNIAKTIGIPPEQVNIKATTTEGLGFCGDGSGMAAYAVCMIRARV